MSAPAPTSNPAPTVALVRNPRRREAITSALGLIADEIAVAASGREVLLKPNLVSHHRQLPSTHADAFAATLDAVFGAGARAVTVAEGASDANAGFEHFGYKEAARGRPVSFFDINRDEEDWGEITLVGVKGEPLVARVSRTIADAPFRVSLALAKTHVTTGATFSLKNMLSSLHPKDRVRMHGYPGGNGSTGWKRPIVEFLKGDNPLVNVLTRSMGRARNLRNLLGGKSGPGGWDRLSPADLGFLRSVAAMHRNLVTLNRAVRPHLAVIDGHLGMHREGPRHGTPIRLDVAIAGTDPVAVDAVAAAVMGFDPLSIGFLALADAAGLGVADLGRIRIVGDPIAKVRRRCVPHSNDAVHRHWRRMIDEGDFAGLHATVSTEPELVAS